MHLLLNEGEENMKKIVLTLIVGCLFSINASAEFVGIPREEFRPHYTPQLESNWCWASSVAMVLSYQGVNVPQQEVVTFIRSGLVNQTAQPEEIHKAVNVVLQKEIDGVPSRIVMSGQLVVGVPYPTTLYNQLKQKKPVIMTYVGPGFGHAVVVTGIDATFDNNNMLHVERVYVFDPFAYSQTQYGFQFDENKVYQDFPLKEVQRFWGRTSVMIPQGEISGMVLMNYSVSKL
jgi:hypothetical protein